MVEPADEETPETLGDAIRLAIVSASEDGDDQLAEELRRVLLMVPVVFGGGQDH